MAKYLVLYKSTQSASEQMANATPEQVKASMEKWIEWKENLDSSIGFEWGMPVQAVSEVTSAGMQDGHSPVSGYAIMDGDRATIAEALQSHPHLKRDGSSIDLLEMLSMPGM